MFWTEKSQTEVAEKAAEVAAKEGPTIGDFINDDGEGDDDYEEEGASEDEDEDEDENEESASDSEIQSKAVEESVPTIMTKTKTTKQAAKAADTNVDSLTKQMKTMTVAPKKFSMTFQFPYIMSEHLDHGQKLVLIEFLIVGVHRRNVHLKVLPGGHALQLKIAVPKLFYDHQRQQLANDDGTGTFNINTHKATGFQQICQEIKKTANDDTDEVFGKPQLVGLPFQCDEIFYTGHGGGREGWDIQIYDNDDTQLRREVGNTDLFTLEVICVAKEKPLQPKARGAMRRVTRAPVPKRRAEDGSRMVEE